MGRKTTITVSKSTKEVLEQDKRDGESWDAYFNRLLESGADLEDVLGRLDDLETTIPSKTAAELAQQFR